ncbi:MAG: S-layer homology domain-containing protein [Oscillospiraceae bacterium]|nr:S-layer homology domain-containing protein [Oscillospiraceae bacterium]
MKRVFIRLSYVLAVIVILLGLMTISSAAATPEYGSLSRGDVVYWLYNTLSSTDNGEIEAVFTDTDGKFYADAANWALSMGYVNGVDQGIFAGDRVITRMELAVIFVRIAMLAVNDFSELSYRDLSNYSDVHAIPDWAHQSVAIALEYEIIEASDKRIDSTGYVDYNTVLNALSAVRAIGNRNILSDITSYHGAYFRNTDNNSILRLGMHMNDVSGAVGIDVKNWSAVGNEDLYIYIMRSRVVSMHISTDDWIWNDSVQIGMLQSEVEEILGEPLPPLEPYGFPMGLPFYYLLDADGNAVQSDAEYSYSLEVLYDDNSLVSDINLSVTANATFMPEANRRIFINTALLSHNQGHGDEVIVINPDYGTVFEARHYGEKEFIITDSADNVMFSHYGSFNGRILMRDIPADGVINISADGYWELSTLNIQAFGQYLYSGNGNFVFWNRINPMNDASAKKLAFTHYGLGEFTLNYVNVYPQSDQEVVEILAEGTGYQTVILEIHPYQPMLVYCFEVISDGRWSFELVE